MEVVKIMATSCKRPHACPPCCTQCPQLCSRPLPIHAPLETSGHSRASLGQSLVGSLLLSLGSWCTQDSVCPPGVCFPVLCKFWQLYGGVNGGLLQEGLCHTQVCCTQSPCPCSSPLLTRTSTGDTQTLRAGLAQSLWCLLGHTRFCLSPLSISGRYGV